MYSASTPPPAYAHTGTAPLDLHARLRYSKEPTCDTGIGLQVCVCVNADGWVDIYAHTYIYTYIHTHAHTHIYTHTYTHTHTHAHTHTHTQNKHSYTAIFTHIHALRCSIDVHNIKKISFIIEREYILTKFIEDKHSCTTISTNIHTLQYSIHIHYRTKISFIIEREHLFIFKHS